MLEKDIFILENLNNKESRLVYAPLRDYVEEISMNYDEAELVGHYERINQKSVQKVIDYKNVQPGLSLALTERCNLKCLYCYADGGQKHKNHTVSKEQLHKVISAYYEHLNNKSIGESRISFNGGCETTCAFKELKYAIALSDSLAERNNIKVRYSMATNGFFNDEICNFIRDHFYRISFSFDGPAFVQNYHRPSSSGANSFDRVMKNAKRLYEMKMQMTFHVVVSKFNIDYLKETLAFFENSFPNTHVVLAKMDATNSLTLVTPPENSDFTEKIMVLKKETFNLNWSTTEEILFGRLRRRHCDSIAIPNWFVTTRGRINACMRDTHSLRPFFDIGYYDKLTDQMTFDDFKLKLLKKYNIDDQRMCKNCFARYLCGGGCPYLVESNDLKCQTIQEQALVYINDKFQKRQTENFVSSVLKDLI